MVKTYISQSTKETDFLCEKSLFHESRQDSRHKVESPCQAKKYSMVPGLRGLCPILGHYNKFTTNKMTKLTLDKHHSCPGTSTVIESMKEEASVWLLQVTGRTQATGPRVAEPWCPSWKNLGVTVTKRMNRHVKCLVTHVNQYGACQAASAQCQHTVSRENIVVTETEKVKRHEWLADPCKQR